MLNFYIRIKNLIYFYSNLIIMSYILILKNKNELYIVFLFILIIRIILDYFYYILKNNQFSFIYYFIDK